MRAIEDFTRIPAGTEVLAEGRVTRCQRCGRGGIEHAFTPGYAFWVHRQTSEVICDGLLVEFEDVCELHTETALKAA